jgi:hypothetical protein
MQRPGWCLAHARPRSRFDAVACFGRVGHSPALADQMGHDEVGDFLDDDFVLHDE